MKKNNSVYVFGPQGVGKTFNAEILMKHYGLGSVVDADSFKGAFPTHDTLILGNSRLQATNRTVLGFDIAIIPYSYAICYAIPSMTKTGWFPAEITPVREGVYEVDDGHTFNSYAWWNGVSFGWRALTPDEAQEKRHLKGTLPGNVKWRGIVRNNNLVPDEL